MTSTAPANGVSPTAVGTTDVVSPSNSTLSSTHSSPRHQQNSQQQPESSGNNNNMLPRDINRCIKTNLQTFVYNHPWEQTISSYMLRFPKHSILPVLLDSEILSDTVDTEKRVRTIVRKCVIDIEAPGWVKRAIGAENIVFTQTTTIEPANRLMKIVNFNETFGDRAVFGDECIFKVSELDSGKTEFRQYGFFSLPKLPLAKICEKIMCKLYEKHSAEGRHIDLAFLQESINSGYWKELSSTGPDFVLKMPAENPQSKKSGNIVAVNGEKKSADSLIVPTMREKTRKSSGASDSMQQAISIENSSASDYSYFPPLIDLSWGIVAVVLFPVALSLKNTVLISTTTIAFCSLLLYWHISRHVEFWLFVLNQISGSSFTVKRKAGKHSKGKKSDSSSSSNSGLVSTPKKRPPLALSSTKQPAVLANANSSSSLIEKFASADSDSDPEHPITVTNDYEYEDEEESESEDDMDAENDDDDDFLPMSEDLSDFEHVKLKDITIEIPAFIDKTLSAGGVNNFIVEVKFPNGRHVSVERLYTDFVRYQKFFKKKIPQCKIQLQSTSIPKKTSNPSAMGMALDQRRLALQKYLRSLLTDESVAKSGHSAMIEFLKRNGPLFPQSTSIASTAKKRLFKASITSAAELIQSHVPGLTSSANMSDIKSINLMMMPWRSCLREIKVVLDKNMGFLNLNTKGQRGNDCVFNLEQLESVDLHIHSDNGSNDTANMFEIPFGRDKYAFISLHFKNGDKYLLCGFKDSLIQWKQDIDLVKSSLNSKSSLFKPNEMSAGHSLRRKTSDFGMQSSEASIILNRKKILFQSSIKQIHPCDYAVTLLKSVLAIFQEYIDAQYTKSPKITNHLLKLTEQCCELQVIDLNSLKSHAEKLSFFANIYHVLVIHAYLELEIMTFKTNPKKVRLLLSSVAYDISNFVFSLQGIQHSILRAKMAKPVSMNGSIFPQIWSQRFKRNDPRNKWALTEQDMRLNFILNNGTNSSIYNVWIFSSKAEVLQNQLSHATTHYLNEQITVDNGRTCIYLPRVCEYYAKDFGGGTRQILKTLIPFMSSQMQREVKFMIRTEQSGGSKMKIRFDDYEWTLRGLFFKGHETMNDDDGCQLKPNENGFQ